MDTLAIWWDASAKMLHFFVLNKTDGAIIFKFDSHDGVNQSNAAARVSDIFGMFDGGESYELEYKVLSPSPLHGSKPNPVSEMVLDAVRVFASSPRCHANQQVRSLLTGEALRRFKTALQDLKFINKKSQKHEWHLWAIGLHATNSQVGKAIKDFYEFRNGKVSTKVERQAYKEWLAQIQGAAGRK